MQNGGPTISYIDAYAHTLNKHKRLSKKIYLKITPLVFDSEAAYRRELSTGVIHWEH